MAFGLCTPPVCPGATLPVPRKRRTQSPCANTYAELRRGLVIRQGFDLNRSNRALAKIQGFAHPCRPPFQSAC
jgi:hypothetical protein